MFKISEFSRLSQVPAKTLRYYAEIGLFEPAKVDPFTGYRYYTAAQLIDLNRILALKALGLSLEQIAALLKEGVSIEQVRGMLRLKRIETLNALQAEQQRLAYLDARLQQLELDGTTPGYEVVVKSLPALRVVSLRETVSDLSRMGEAAGRVFGRLFEYLHKHGQAPAGAPIGLYYDEEMPEAEIDFAGAIPYVGVLPETDEFKLQTLPACEAACTVYRGSFEQIGQAYQRMLWWLDTNHYTLTTPNREVYLEYGQTPADNITEIQHPFQITG
jgi:DNA-binding transcriptional MerR regulator